jgi:hypothetical protein
MTLHAWWIRGSPLDPCLPAMPAKFTMLSTAIFSAALPQEEFQFYVPARYLRFAGDFGHCGRVHQSTRGGICGRDKKAETSFSAGRYRGSPFAQAKNLPIPSAIAKMGPEPQGRSSPHFSIPLMSSARAIASQATGQQAKRNNEKARGRKEVGRGALSGSARRPHGAVGVGCMTEPPNLF